jgi:hypothetical protein
MAGGNQQRRRELAIAALLAESTVEQAAARAGISYRTLKQWLTQADFQAAYRQARRAVVDAVIGQLQQAGAKAVSTLVAALDATKTADQIRAAGLILAHVLRDGELADLQAELQSIREALAHDHRGDDPPRDSGPEASAAGTEAAFDDDALADGSGPAAR